MLPTTLFTLLASLVREYHARTTPERLGSAPGLQSRGGVVGAAAGDLEVAGDAGGGVARRQALTQRGEDVRVDLLVAGLGRGRRGREHQYVLTTRLGPLDVGDGLVERAPPHLFVQFRELAGDGHLAQRAARGQQVRQRRVDP